MSAESAIRIDNLRVVRGRNVVPHELACEVEHGSVTGLLGPSGSGKTTLIRSIVGVQRIAAGRVDVLGEPAGTKTLRSRVGYMTQASSVYDDLTVRENLRFFARVLGAPPEAVERTTESVALHGERDRIVARLSGGERAPCLARGGTDRRTRPSPARRTDGGTGPGAAP